MAFNEYSKPEFEYLIKTSINLHHTHIHIYRLETGTEAWYMSNGLQAWSLKHNYAQETADSLNIKAKQVLDLAFALVTKEVKQQQQQGHLISSLNILNKYKGAISLW